MQSRNCMLAFALTIPYALTSPTPPFPISLTNSLARSLIHRFPSSSSSSTSYQTIGRLVINNDCPFPIYITSCSPHKCTSTRKVADGGGTYTERYRGRDQTVDVSRERNQTHPLQLGYSVEPSTLNATNSTSTNSTNSTLHDNLVVFYNVSAALDDPFHDIGYEFTDDETAPKQCPAMEAVCEDVGYGVPNPYVYHASARGDINLNLCTD